MEYKSQIEVKYDATTPGTAGVAQRISSGNRIKKVGKLFALVQNDLMTCGHNQY